MALIFSAMAGASVWFPRCCSECGCGKRRGPLTAEAQCTSTKMDLQAPRCRLLGFSSSSRFYLRSAAESKDAQTSVACCRGKNHNWLCSEALVGATPRILEAAWFHAFPEVAALQFIEDLSFGKQAFELLVQLEPVFMHPGFTQDRYERFRCQPWT